MNKRDCAIFASGLGVGGLLGFGGAFAWLLLRDEKKGWYKVKAFIKEEIEKKRLEEIVEEERYIPKEEVVETAAEEVLTSVFGEDAPTEGIHRIQYKPPAAVKLLYFAEDEILCDQALEESDSGLLQEVMEAHFSEPMAGRLYFFDYDSGEGYEVTVTHTDYASEFNKLQDERMAHGDILYSEEE